MLLAIDIGNTNTIFALCDEASVVERFRTQTRAPRTPAEFAPLLDGNVDLVKVKDVIISSVVPDMDGPIRAFCKNLTGSDPLFVSRASVPIGVDLDKPEEVGADRLVNAIAVLAHYSAPAIVVDFGTATTFDVIDEKGRYAGGAIAPGINLSLETLHKAAAKLPQIDVAKPNAVIGKDTESAMRSGIYWGYIGLIEGLIAKLSAEMGETPFVIATGGLAPLFAGSTDAIEQVDGELTLKGLIKIYQDKKNEQRTGKTATG